MVDLGHGVLFATVREAGRLAGNGGQVEQRRGWVFLCVHGMLERLPVNLGIEMPAQPPNDLPNRGGRRCRRRMWSTRDAVELME